MGSNRFDWSLAAARHAAAFALLTACSSQTTGGSSGADSGSADGAATVSSGGNRSDGGTGMTGGAGGDGGSSGTGGTSGTGGGNLDAGPDAPITTAPATLGAVLLFDSTCPAGYTELTDLRDRYARGHDGDTDRAERGGYESHTHDLGAHAHVALEAGSAHTHAITLGNPTQTTQNDVTASLGNLSSHTHRHTGSASGPGGGPHEHTIGEAPPQTTEATNNLPPFREFVFCRLELPESNVPRSAMVLSGATCGAGFDEVLDAQNRLLRGHDGDDTYGETGGSEGHAHAFPHDHGGMTHLGGGHAHGGTTANSSEFSVVQRHADEQNSSLPSHQHTITVPEEEHQHGFSGPSVLAEADSLPSYHEVAVCRAEQELPLSTGMLVLYDDVECPDGFSEKSEFRDRFLLGNDGDDTFGERSGSDLHDHDSSHDHGGMTAALGHDHGGVATIGPANATQITARCCRGASGPVAAAAGGHTHGASVGIADMHSHPISAVAPSITMGSNVPLYRELIVCEKN